MLVARNAPRRFQFGFPCPFIDDPAGLLAGTQSVLPRSYRKIRRIEGLRPSSRSSLFHFISLPRLSPDCYDCFGPFFQTVPVRVTVNTDGSVTVPASLHSVWISLAGIHYVAMPQPTDESTFENEWTPFSMFGYQPAYVEYSRGLCVVGGLAKLKAPRESSEIIGTLPKSCRPTSRMSFGVEAHKGPVRVDVLPSGQILLVCSTLTPISLIRPPSTRVRNFMLFCDFCENVF